jgi:hypothetical protein
VRLQLGFSLSGRCFDATGREQRIVVNFSGPLDAARTVMREATCPTGYRASESVVTFSKGWWPG